MSDLDLTEAIAKRIADYTQKPEATWGDREFARRIEAQVRERIAADIEVAALGHEDAGDCDYNCMRCVTDSAYGYAARIARGSAS